MPIVSLFPSVNSITKSYLPGCSGKGTWVRDPLVRFESGLPVHEFRDLRANARYLTRILLPGFTDNSTSRCVIESESLGFKQLLLSLKPEIVPNRIHGPCRVFVSRFPGPRLISSSSIATVASRIFGLPVYADTDSSDPASSGAALLAQRVLTLHASLPPYPREGPTPPVSYAEHHEPPTPPFSSSWATDEARRLHHAAYRLLANEGSGWESATYESMMAEYTRLQ